MVVVAFVLSLNSTVGAHPGHGEAGASHYLNAPEHALPLVVIVGLATFGLVVAKRVCWGKTGGQQGH